MGLAGTKWARPAAWAADGLAASALPRFSQLRAQQKQTNVGVGHPLSGWQPSKRHQQQLRPEFTSHPRWQLPEDGDKSQAARPLRWEAGLVSLRKGPQPLTQFLTNYPGKRSPRYRHPQPDELERQTTGDRQTFQPQNLFGTLQRRRDVKRDGL